MRIALTGASGYTGGRLLEALRARGDQVSVLVRPRSVADRLRALASRIVEGDLGDARAVARLVEGNEAVLHVAAVYRTAGHPDSYYREVNQQVFRSRVAPVRSDQAVQGVRSGHPGRRAAHLFGVPAAPQLAPTNHSINPAQTTPLRRG